MTDLKTAPEVIKIPYPTEGIIRTANIDDTVTPSNSAELAVNMNFDRIGAIKTREGVQSYADILVDGINNYGTLKNSYPDGFEKIIRLGAQDSFGDNLGSLTSAKVDDTHIILFYTDLNTLKGYVSVLAVDANTGNTVTVGGPTEFESANNFNNSCIKIDDNHFLNAWRGEDDDGFAQVFSVDLDTFEITAESSKYEFDTTNSKNFSLAQVDSDHVICFYTGNNDADGIATIFEINLSTWVVTEPGSPYTFASGVSAQNACVSLEDGTHFMNTWNGIAKTFEVNTGTWAISELVSVSYLLVGGGGGAGGTRGGGGGGGQVASGTDKVVPGAYSISVGSGGTGGTGSGNGTNGGSSSFNSHTALGGGYGGGAGNNGGNGYNGGGAGGDNSSRTGGTGTSGFNGGDNFSAAASADRGSGGGAGASANGSNATLGTGGNGGNGTASSISGASVTYGGGGAGDGGTTGGTGGSGGGANANHAGTGFSGTNGLGGGGGGGDGDGGNGGSGVVIISAPQDTITATGGVKTTVGGNDIWTFTTSGTWTVTAVQGVYTYDSAGSSYNSIVNSGDDENYVLFWRSATGGVGKCQVLNSDPVTFFITGQDSPYQFALKANQNALVSLGDGIHYVNFWSDDSDNGFTQVFEVDQMTFAITTSSPSISIGGLSSGGVAITTDQLSLYKVVAFWANATNDAVNLGGVFKISSDMVNGFLYASSGDKVYNTQSTTWTERRSGLAEVSKARFSQYLGYIWMVNGNETIGGDPVATSNGSDFGTDLVPEDFPKGDFINAGFEGRIWTLDKSTGIINYTDIVQFVPPNGYTITYNPDTNFISTISPQVGQTFTGVFQVPRALLVFTQDYIWRIYGASSLDAYPAYNVGTYSQESIVATKSGIFFHHSSGFYQFDYGSQPVEISRRIIDFVKAIPRSYYENITGVYDGFDAILWSIGPVTVDGVTFTNCVVRYTLSTQVWTIYDYTGNDITAMITYDDGTNLNHLMGTEAGKTGAMDTGTTDFGSPFYYEYIDRWRTYSDCYAKQQSITGVNVYSENAAGANISYQIQKSGPNVWEPFGTITEANNSILANASTSDFDVARIRITGNSKGTPVVIHGVEILNLTIKGFNTN